MEFEAVARPRCFRANREKDVNFVTNVCYPNSHSICVSAVWKKFPKIARHTGSLLQRKRDGSHVWMLVLLSLWVSGPSPCSHCQGKMIVKNDLQANLFMQWLSDHSMQRKLSSFEEGKALMESVFRLLFIKNSLDAKRWDLQVCPKDLTSRVRTLCVFPYTFCGLKTPSYVILGMTMRKQAMAVCLKVLIAILWLPRRGDIQLEMSQQLAIASRLHAPGVLKGGTKLLLT